MIAQLLRKTAGQLRFKHIYIDKNLKMGADGLLPISLSTDRAVKRFCKATLKCHCANGSLRSGAPAAQTV